MPDITSIATVLSSIKTATDIAKIIRTSNSNLTDAETKLQIAELITALADVKLDLASVQDTLRSKDEEILRLNNEIYKRNALTFDGKLYFMEGDDVPFCPVCFESETKHHHLNYYPIFQGSLPYHKCKICKNVF